MKMGLQKLPGWVHCPACQLAFNGRYGISESGDPRAPTWEVNICTACGTPSMFTPDREELRALTLDELATLRQDPAFLEAMAFTSRAIARREKAALN